MTITLETLAQAEALLECLPHLEVERIRDTYKNQDFTNLFEYLIKQEIKRQGIVF